jgi:hypothetical protein|tara:strand:- start:3515 stop:3757 length:243 start_codon:yes stop_codon:yes gene_type:complete
MKKEYSRSNINHEAGNTNLDDYEKYKNGLYTYFNITIPMGTILVHTFKNEDKRELSFEDWIVYIIKQNKHKLPWNRKATK